MKNAPTKVIFFWHMHQPDYMHPDKNYYILPWVRLRGVKDYFGMAKIVEKFKTIKVSVNFSGILLKQLADYALRGAKDYWGILTLKNPKYLKKEEKDFLLDRFFWVNFEHAIRSNLRYLQLYNKKAAHKRFTVQDFLDLQVLFNLAWFHPYTIRQDRTLKKIIQKGRDYTQDDKVYVIKKQYEVLAHVLPLYKRLMNQGRIECTITPYHHPIMPLIYDTDVVDEFSYLKTPAVRYSAPEHCAWHLHKARDIYQEVFGRKPEGSWPSEGSVSEEIAALYHHEGFKWIGTDEAILFKSLSSDYVPYDMIKNQRHLIYRPYKFKGTNIFFRDRNLSDAISFIYQGWEDQKIAAQHLIEHFKRTHSHVKNFFKERAITIIMDGENAWEYYRNNGLDFLETMYASLEKEPDLETTTPSQFLEGYQAKHLERLRPGSWINGDFGVWAGSPANNNYWRIVKRMKTLIDRGKVNTRAKTQAYEYLHLLEGSDWFWWNTFEDPSGEFKRIFYTYVNKIYELVNKPVPAYVKGI